MVNAPGEEAAPASRQADSRAAPRHDVDEDQLVERLGWTPKQRLDYLLDMLAFEERARAARIVATSG